jgi:hypothetical protein
MVSFPMRVLDFTWTGRNRYAVHHRRRLAAVGIEPFAVNRLQSSLHEFPIGAQARRSARAADDAAARFYDLVFKLSLAVPAVPIRSAEIALSHRWLKIGPAEMALLALRLCSSDSYGTPAGLNASP